MGLKVAVVTGGYQGIGYEIVKGIAKKFSGDVYLTSRNADNGIKSVEKLNNYEKLNNVFYHQLDILNKQSIIELKEHILEKYGGLDILINNAGINDKTIPDFGIKAEIINETNFFAVKKTCDILFPILRPGGRVVNVSSTRGWLAENMKVFFKCEFA